jgi:hypothetical protein
VRRVVVQAPIDALELGSTQLKSIRDHWRDLAIERSRRAKRTKAEQRAIEQESKRLRQREYREKLKLLKEYGTYAPLSGELTPYRKTTINRRFRELEHLWTEAAFAPYPTKSATTRKEIKKQARSVKAKITKKGIFLPRAEKELRQPKGTLHFDKKTGLWEVHVHKLVKFKTHRPGLPDQRVFHEVRPLGGHLALLAKEKQIVERFKKLPTLKPNERLRFRIDGVNASRSTFTSIQQLLRYARDGYRKTERGKAAFMNSLTIEIVRKVSPKKRWVRGNVRTVDGFKARYANYDVSDYLLEGYDDDELDELGEEEE